MSVSDLPSAQTDLPAPTGSDGNYVAGAIRWVNWIWRIRGKLDPPDGQSASSLIDRLVPLFEAPSTTHQRDGNMLLFTKQAPLAHDRLAVFDAGRLIIADAGQRLQLHYDLSSRFLLACFLAPFLFLAFGQLGIAAAEYQKAKSEASKAEAAKDKDKDKPEIVLNPIDIALGAPAPLTRKEMKAEKEKKDKEPPSAMPAYIFAGIFAFLYVLGRILEERLARSLFRKQLLL